MPSPWKKAKLGGVPRLVSNVRSKAKQGVEESPLVVQAGFPTSVADLVVKNRCRLRKPTRWLRHHARRNVGGVAAGFSSTMATLASEIIAASVSAAAHLPPTPEPTEQLEQRSPRAAGVTPWGGYEAPGDAHRSPSPCSSPAGLDAGRESPGSPLATTTTAKTVMDHDFEPLSGADVPKDELLHGLSGKKVPKSEIFQPFATSKTPNDDGSHTSLPVTEALKHEALNGSDGPTAQTDVSRQAFPEVPRSVSMQSSPRAEARKDEATGPSFVVEAPEREVLEGGSGGGSTVVVVNVVFLVVILALVSKKMAIMISVLAVAILLVESVGRRIFPSLRHEEKQCLGTIATSDLIQTPEDSNSHDSDGIPTNSAGSGSLGSERNWGVGGLGAPLDATEALTGKTAVAASEEKDVVETEGCVMGGQKGSAANKKKKKKLFMKLVSVKFRGCKCGKEGKLEERLEPASNPSGSGEAPCQRGVLVEASSGGQEEEEGEEDGQGVDSEKGDGIGEEEDVVGSGIPATAHRVHLRDAAFVGGKDGEATNGSFGYLVSVLVVLLGLLSGRMMALILTVLSYSLVSYARSLWRRWNSQALCRPKEE